MVYDYDIILLDLSLPDMSGFEVLRSLRKSKVEVLRATPGDVPILPDRMTPTLGSVGLWCVAC
jgi:CheY-like chemotaxis protein